MRISLDGWDFFGIVEEKLFGGCGFDAQSGVVSGRGSLVLAGGYMEREMEYLQKAGEYLTNVITTISYTNYIIYKISLENTLEIWKDANISLNWVSSCDKALLSKLKYQSSNIKAITWKPDYRSASIKAQVSKRNYRSSYRLRSTWRGGHWGRARRSLRMRPCRGSLSTGCKGLTCSSRSGRGLQ